MNTRIALLVISTFIALPLIGFAIGWFLMEVGLGGWLILLLAAALMWRSPAALTGAFMATRRWLWRM